MKAINPINPNPRAAFLNSDSITATEAQDRRAPFLLGNRDMQVRQDRRAPLMDREVRARRKAALLSINSEPKQWAQYLFCLYVQYLFYLIRKLIRKPKQYR